MGIFVKCLAIAMFFAVISAAPLNDQDDDEQLVLVNLEGDQEADFQIDQVGVVDSEDYPRFKRKIIGKLFKLCDAQFSS